MLLMLPPAATEATKPTELTLRDGAVAAYCPVLSASTRLRGRGPGGEASLCQRGRSRVGGSTPLRPASHRLQPIAQPQYLGARGVNRGLSGLSVTCLLYTSPSPR